MFAKLWNRLGLVTSRDAHTAAEGPGKRLDRWEKRAGHVTEILDQHEKQTAATAGALAELKVSVGKLQQSVDAVRRPRLALPHPRLDARVRDR